MQALASRLATAVAGLNINFPLNLSLKGEVNLHDIEVREIKGLSAGLALALARRAELAMLTRAKA